jgi:hypothetical protein
MGSSRVSVSRLGFVEGGPAYVVVAAFVFLDERHIGHNDWRGFICGACWRERERGGGGGVDSVTPSRVGLDVVVRDELIELTGD